MTDDPIIAEAEARHAAHLDHPTHRPLSDGYELVGLRGEEELARVFGGAVDMTRRPNGDGGIDKVITLRMTFRVDVKCARKPKHLLVEVGKCRARTIYILAGYDDETDRAALLGWEWGRTLLKAPTGEFGYGVLNYYIPRSELRGLDELLERLL